MTTEIPGWHLFVARVEMTLGILLLASAAAAWGAWISEVDRPGHHGEVAFFVLCAQWAVLPGIALLLAGVALRRWRVPAWVFAGQTIALVSPLLSWLLLKRMWGIP